MEYWQHAVIQPAAKELLEKIRGSIHSRIGPHVLVLGFTPQWLSGGGSYRVGRLDYMTHDAPTVHSAMLEGTENSVVSYQPLGSRMASMVNYGRSLLEIEFEGPGFRIREI